MKAAEGGGSKGVDFPSFYLSFVVPGSQKPSSCVHSQGPQLQRVTPVKDNSSELYLKQLPY